jgi:histidine triad (HIT) family protein
MDDNCIFCKIVSGVIPSYQVYEDDLFFGFMDIKPLNPGNTLLIPKSHCRWVVDVPDFGRYWEVARKIGMAALPLVKADYLSFLTLGMEVPHAHIRIIPRFFNDAHTHGIDTTQIYQAPEDELKLLAQKINYSITHA